MVSEVFFIVKIYVLRLMNSFYIDVILKIMEKTSLIQIKNCSVQNSKKTLLNNISWEMKTGESWLVIGPNSGGKDIFISALEGKTEFVPNAITCENPISMYSSVFNDSVQIVSLEKAAALIEEERNRDESEYIEGGVDIGRTGRVFICEDCPENASRLESFPQVKLCGVEKILDRGLKYMSTGEIRRILLTKALLSGKQLLILSDPFAGLDVESRGILLDFFDTISKKSITEEKIQTTFPRIILSMERFVEIPEAITNVLEFTDGNISFCGVRSDYEKLHLQRSQEDSKNREKNKQAFESELVNLREETSVISDEINDFQNEDESANGQQKELVPLIEMKDVNVGWDGNLVLKNLNWALYKNQHWLIRGPNGSGKTTFLELITGDNMQVFCNDIKIFGNRRGSGETIWDIKQKLGIVSYRLHVEYRMVGGTSLRNVIMSGFHDSIGLYEVPSDVETAAAEKWLKLGGFEGRGSESFGNLSYGEQRAILILRAAVKCPQILILDEPCHGLDENTRRKILDLIEIIAESGTTTLLHVTHEPSEVLSCEKHILEFHPGESPMYKIIEM